MAKSLLLFLAFLPFFCCQCIQPNDVPVSGRCFSLVPTPKSFKNAQTYCHQTSSNLAVIENSVQNNYLAAFASTRNLNISSFWIGLSRTQAYSSFVWDDNSTLQWTNFKTGYPGKQNFVTELAENGKWITNGPNVKLPFFCSSQPRTTTSTTTTTTSMTPVKKCPNYAHLFKGKCYFFAVYSENATISKDATPLTREIQICENLGSSLVTIHSEDLNDFIRSVAPSDVTIGIRHLNRDIIFGDWEWFDNSDLDFKKWSRNEPDNDGFIGRLGIWNSGSWYASTRTLPQQYVSCVLNN